MMHQLLLLANYLKEVDRPLFDHLAANHSENMFFCFRWLLILFKREFRYLVRDCFLWHNPLGL